MFERIAKLREVGVIAVIRAPDAETARLATRALVEGGVTGIEITYSTPDAASVIEELRAEWGGQIHLGAGTITTVDQALEAHEAGAEFLVSPGTNRDVLETMLSTGRVTLSGALTPSEVMLAVGTGTDVVKLFPASLGGPTYLKALRGPFPDVHFIPTGGVSVANLREWLQAGAIAVGAGSDLISGTDMRMRDWEGVTLRAREYMLALGTLR